MVVSLNPMIFYSGSLLQLNAHNKVHDNKKIRQYDVTIRADEIDQFVIQKKEE